MCDPERSASHIGEGASGFFSPPQNNQLFAPSDQTPVTRTASSLLSDLLQQDALWNSAVELLNLLSQVARCSSQLASPRIRIETAVLRQALTHPYDQMRAATCRFVGNVEPFRPDKTETLQTEVFIHTIDCLSDSCTQVRRMASRAVGNWLGFVAAKFKIGGKRARSRIEAAGDSVTEQTFDADEQRRWTDEAQRSVTLLMGLLSDPDAVTRRHCCAALGNLVHVEGVVSEDLYSSLLRAARADSNSAVQQAATAALRLCNEREEEQQGMK